MKSVSFFKNEISSYTAFLRLVKELRKRGYKIDVRREYEYDKCLVCTEKNNYESSVWVRNQPFKKLDYYFAWIENSKGITGGFATANNNSYWYIGDRICFDSNKCFDKYSKCPYSLPIPRNQRELKYVLKKIKYLRTRKGYKLSNTFGIDYEEDYPWKPEEMERRFKRKLKREESDKELDEWWKKVNSVKKGEKEIL